MPLFVFYMHKASSYPAISRDNCHLQIGCHKTHAIGSCVERPTWKMDVCIVRVRYPIPTRKGGQRASVGGSQHFPYAHGPCTLTDRLVEMDVA
jgi:hypothetical protein